MHTTVLVRSITGEEEMELDKLLRRSPTARIWRRARAIVFSAAGMAAPQIGKAVLMSARTVRELIREFNGSGIAALYDGKRSGRKKNSWPRM